MDCVNRHDNEANRPVTGGNTAPHLPQSLGTGSRGIYSRNSTVNHCSDPLFRTAYTHTDMTHPKHNVNGVSNFNPSMSSTRWVPERNTGMGLGSLIGQPDGYCPPMYYPDTPIPDSCRPTANTMDEFMKEFKSTMNPQHEAAGGVEEEELDPTTAAHTGDKTDENNNFIMEHYGDFVFDKCSRRRTNRAWRQHRYMCALSQPKHQHQDQPTRSVSLYDVKGEPCFSEPKVIPRTCDGRIIPICNPRIDELARPKTYNEDVLGKTQRRPTPTCTESLLEVGECPKSQNTWRTCDGRILPECNPRLDRLARPKRYCDYDLGNNKQKPKQYQNTQEWKYYGLSPFDSCDSNSETDEICHQAKPDPYAVKRAALNAVPTRRLEKLAVPKKVVDSGEFYLWQRYKKPNVDEKLKPVKKLCIDKIDLKDQRIFLRCDLDYKGYLSGTTSYTVSSVDHSDTIVLNYPLHIEQKLANILPTIMYCLDRGAKSVVIASHCGDPRGRIRPGLSLKCISDTLAKILNREITFCEDCTGIETMALGEDPEPGSILFLENLRFNPEEEGCGIDENGHQFSCTKEEVKDYRQKLFSLGDVYILDSFTNLVNMTNTTVGDPNQERGYGFNVKAMLDVYNRYITKPAKPMVAIIGGEFNEMIDVVYNLMGKADEILLGGEIAHIFLKTLRGIDIGITKSSSAKEKKVLKAMSRAKDICCTINLPSDLVVRDTENSSRYFTICTKLDVLPSFEIMDVGIVTRKCYSHTILGAVSVVWIGGMGILLDGTRSVAYAVSSATLNGSKTFITDERTLDLFSNISNQGEVADVNSKDGVVEVQLSKAGFITDVMQDGDVMHRLLHAKMPKCLAALSPYRKRFKKRVPKEEDKSRKPLNRDIPCYRVENGSSRLCIDDMDVEGKRVLIVTDLTAGVAGNAVTDNVTIRMALPTIKWVLKRGAELVMIVSPIHRRLSVVEGEEENTSLKPMVAELEMLLYRDIIFIDQYSDHKVQRTIETAHPGSVIMFENILLESEEHYTFEMVKDYSCRGKVRIPEHVAGFCDMLSSWCDIYVNDAFSLLSKDRSSVTGCTHIERPCGFLVKNQLKYFSNIFNYPKRRFLVIIGGHGESPEGGAYRQMDIARMLARDADEMILTGSLGMNCLHVQHGKNLGLPYEMIIKIKQDVEDLMEFLKKNDVRLYFPIDLVVKDDKEDRLMRSSRQTESIYKEEDEENDEEEEEEEIVGFTTVSTSQDVPRGKVFVDVGPKTNSLFRRIIKRARLALWLGVAGMCDSPESYEGTRAMYDTLVECTQSGGEDSLVSIGCGPIVSQFSHEMHPNSDGLSHTVNTWSVPVALLTEKRLPALDRISFNSKARQHSLVRMSLSHTDISKKRVLLRCDFIHIFRPEAVRKYIEEMSSTIKKIFSKGATSIVVFGHMGEPQGRKDDTYSIRSCRQALEKAVHKQIKFFENGLSDAMMAALQAPEPGTLAMLENLRFNPEEEGYGIGSAEKNVMASYDATDDFRHRLSKLGDVFINDSMESLNTTDSSVVGLLNEVRIAGPQVHQEFTQFSSLIPKFKAPILCIVGGKNILEKIRHLYDIIDFVNEIIICGALSFTFLKLVFGMQIGKSEFDKEGAKLVSRVMKKAKANNVPIHMPKDFMNDKAIDDEAADNLANRFVSTRDLKTPKTSKSNLEFDLPVSTRKTGIPENTKAMDIGPSSTNFFVELIKRSNVILFTGRAGILEDGTTRLVDAITERTEDGAISIAYDCRVLSTRSVHYDGFSHVSNASPKLFADILLGRPLPGLDYLNPTVITPPPVPSVYDTSLAGKKVILKIDLDVPTVEGVVLNTDKIESALPTIRYILEQEPLSLILCGSRGNPHGYKNYYLSMEPLVNQFEHFLGVPVIFVDSPCSRAARIVCEEPVPGSVFLLENLKFYPAELGSDDEVPDMLDEDSDMMSVGADVMPYSDSAFDVLARRFTRKNVKATSSYSSDLRNKLFNLDKLMWEVMPAKTVEQFTREIGDLGEVFVNDDVSHMWEDLTSNFGFDLSTRVCGPLLADELSRSESKSYMTRCPAVVAMLPGSESALRRHSSIGIIQEEGSHHESGEEGKTKRRKSDVTRSQNRSSQNRSESPFPK